MTDHPRTDHPAAAGLPKANQPRKPYTAPKMLSVEPLEAVAAACDSTGGFGKSVPSCSPGNLGS